ncbi:MAG: nuclear transport factor 2 family protein [Chloroflexi bacterium]|nr:nuclear transport factor 2 family protein [Chloroflexota bacterium]
MSETNNRTKVAAAFQGWIDGTSYISELLADDLQWEIVGNSLAAKHYTSKQQFLDEVLRPFGARFSERFRPTVIRGIYADGDTVIVLWDGEGTALDGQSYTNTYAWFLTMRDGLVVRAVAFFDSIAFNDLWTRVQPAE